MQVNKPYLKERSNDLTVTLRISTRQVIGLRARFCAILRLTRDSHDSRSGSVSSPCDLDAPKLRLRSGRRTQGMDMERAV
jgi:hypothetical protein